MKTSINLFATVLVTFAFSWTTTLAQETANISNNLTYLADSNNSKSSISVISEANVYHSAIFHGRNFKSIESYFAKNVTFPKTGISTGKSGSMKVWFEILPDGSVGETRIEDSPGAAFDEAVIQCLSTMPRWTPAYFGSTPVKSTQAVKLNFRLR